MNKCSELSPIYDTVQTSSSGIIGLSDEEAIFMTNQDKRAVESMCQCGLDLDGVIASFPKLDPTEVEGVYWAVKEMIGEVVKIPMLKVNCS